MRTDKEKYGLRGPVKNVLIETAKFEEHDGQIAEKPWFSYAHTFNRDGHVIEQVTRNPDGSEWRTVNDYSDSGNLLATRSFDPTGTLNGEVRYIYDANDRLAGEQHVTRDGRVTTPTTYTYDAGGMVKIQQLDYPGIANAMIGVEGISTFISTDQARRTESRYDDQGEAVEVKVFNVDGELVCRVAITRDARGNPLEETQYVGDFFSPGPCTPHSCSTEEMAVLTEEQKAEIAAELARLFPRDTVMSRYTHTYDKEGRLIESKLMMMGMEVSSQTFAYDEVGNRSEEVSHNGNDASRTKTIYAREYDQHGNWTKELVSIASNWDAEFGMSTPAHVTRRTITYW